MGARVRGQRTQEWGQGNARMQTWRWGQGEQFEREKSNSNAGRDMGTGTIRMIQMRGQDTRTGGDSNDSNVRMGTWGRG